MADFNGIRNRQGNIVQAPGEPVIHQFAFSHSTPALNNGVTIYTPTPGDILLDAWIEVDTAFNGTTPMADIGRFTSQTTGWFGLWTQPVDLTHADVQIATGEGYLASPGSGKVNLSLAEYTVADVSNRQAPGVFTTNAPVKLVVSQDGTQGGTATGATAGAGIVYLYVGTPV